MANPPGIKYQAIYEPDMDKMVKALKIIQKAPVKKDSRKDEKQEGA